MFKTAIASKRPLRLSSLNFTLACLVSLWCSFAVRGQGSAPGGQGLTLGAPFSDNMVLQRGKEIRVWGAANPGREVEVRFKQRVRKAIADQDGNWMVSLPPMRASSFGESLTVSCGEAGLELENVLLGDVWLCSGQSNMNWNVARSLNAETEIAAATDTLIRHAKVKREVREAPSDRATLIAGWQETSPEVVGAFTAVGYFFAQRMREELKVPIGVVNCSVSGSQIEAWLSAEALASEPEFKKSLERWAEHVAVFPERNAVFQRYLKEESEAREKGEEALASFRAQSKRVRQPLGPGHRNTPSGLYNGMLRPLAPLSIRGILWYQGEGNGANTEEYGKLFAALIESWRAEFGQGDLPFYWVQLAGRESRPGWVGVREAQSRTEQLGLPNTGQAVAIDIGDRNDSHPKNKQEVARRLALLALAKEFGRKLEYSGPVPRSVSVRGEQLTVAFDHAQQGLVAKGKLAASLEVAGEDEVYFPGQARIEGSCLLVSSPKVLNPRLVRYAWKDYPEAILYNKAGLPAGPFRARAATFQDSDDCE